MVKNIFGLLDPRLSNEIVKRILAGSHERPENEFYRLVLENEKQFIRTREWWAKSKPK